MGQGVGHVYGTERSRKWDGIDGEPFLKGSLRERCG